MISLAFFCFHVPEAGRLIDAPTTADVAQLEVGFFLVLKFVERVLDWVEWIDPVG